MKSILLIGGSNIDYIGTSDLHLIKKQSNIGKVSIHFGGVLRNTCENLARLGNSCAFITAIGNDVYGLKMRDFMEKMGIKLVIPSTLFSSSTNIVINDCDHKMNVGVCDDRIINDISLDFIKANNSLIKKFKYLVIDANLKEEVIDYIFSEFKEQKIICAGISKNKIVKFKNYLNKIFLLKCNILEAQTLIDFDLVDQDLVGGLLARGIKNVVVSNSSHDIYYGTDNRDIGKVIVEEIKEYESTTGCGAALLSGVIDNLLLGKSLKESVIFGNKLAALTLNCIGGTCEEIAQFAHK